MQRTPRDGRARRRSARWLLTSGGFAALAVLESAASAQGSTGTVDLHLGPPAGITLISTTARISSPSMPPARTVTAGGGTGSFVVTGLPVASDYTADVTSMSSGGLVCTGSSSTFPVEADTTTILFVSLACASAVPALSGAHVWLLTAAMLCLAVLALRDARPRPG